MGYKNQVIATLIVSYLCMTTGVLFTWPSSVIKVFRSENTPLNRIMSETEISLLGSLTSISALFTIPLCGLSLDKLGSKYTCVVLALLQVIGWAVVICFDYVESILAAVFIGGLSSCIYLVGPLYVGEFCQEDIRGTMTAAAMTFFPVGGLISYIMGVLDYRVINYICLTMNVVGTFLQFYLWESPLFQMKKGLEKEAMKTIAHYRGVRIDSKEVHQEINNLKVALNPDLDDATPEAEKLQPQLQSTVQREKLSAWQFLKKSRSSRRALFLCFVLYTAVVFQGQVVIQVYAEPLFSLAVPSVSPTVCTVVFAVVNIMAGLIVLYLVDRSGRRPLMIYSSLMTALFASLLGTQIQFSWGPNWLTAVLIYLFCITFNTGAGMIPFTVSAEIFLPEIKNFATIVTMEYSFVGFFVILFIYHPLVSVIGLGPIFYIFALVCLLTTVFCHFYMPETKGLTVDAIQHLFVPRSHNKV
ncbi:facilitated trehalose transporter Tret1-like isoform X1 [Colias croceus]|uniref:facilitated trehalose transporter Tret1-like isoform X1 n=2 Tax=Colias crocea TaxID=72248 RepID=UPI001E27BDB4|nr:facilitated trehalose transporter Tret1-like isoform X1 [Colias croceus]